MYEGCRLQIYSWCHIETRINGTPPHPQSFFWYDNDKDLKKPQMQIKQRKIILLADDVEAG